MKTIRRPKKAETVSDVPHEVASKKLTPIEYWEWRTTISEMDTKKVECRIAEFQLKLLEKDAEIAVLRLNLHKANGLKAAHDKMKEYEAEYKRFKEVLEKRLGTSLNGKIITDTFEVIDDPPSVSN